MRLRFSFVNLVGAKLNDIQFDKIMTPSALRAPEHPIQNSPEAASHG
jgi:hypothetical protein